MIRTQVLWRTITMATALSVVAACNGDRAIAPSSAPVGVRASMGSGDSGGSFVSSNSGSNDTTFTTFTVRPDRGIVKTLNGGHQLAIAAHAICDLSSSYGPDEWDQPCAPATTPVTISARSWIDANGHPRVDFRPRLRFVPSDQANAILWLMDKTAAYDPSYKIFYCADGASVCIDESITDPTVATQRDVRGFLYRRIKHFSGYNIASGYAAESAE